MFTKEPEAEFVAEGGQKASVPVEFAPVPGEIHKAQVTVRMDSEVQWADEDNQLQIIDAIVAAGSAALGRALDYGILHAVNPVSGAAISTMTALTAGAIADRVCHHCHLIKITGRSYRLKDLPTDRKQGER